MWPLFVKGLIIGFSIAAPVGPIGLLCIRKTLLQGMSAGVVSGLGAAAADAIYGSIAAFGITVIAQFLLEQQVLLKLIGGSFLCFLGYKSFTAAPPDSTLQVKSTGIFKAFLSTFLLTITNPMTILSFAGIFAGLGIGTAVGDRLGAVQMVAGVFAGSLLWWFVLSGCISAFREKVNERNLGLVNKISGLVIMLFGIVAIIGR
ncbi:hypothetical protein SRRS_01020 [Sporomusa rhizae]|uniref:LysE family translocator n=1 Tax=Sporomusa rhizae TaxID=357999 RepID=UPI00352ACFE5